MMMSGPFEILLLFLLSATTPGDLPPDLAGLLEPDAILGQLGHDTEEATLAKLIQAGDGTAEAPSEEVAKDIENAVQNLASRSDKVRESAREKLVEAGEGVRARLETVVANDARRADEAKKVLEALDGLVKTAGHRTALARLAAIRHAGKATLTSLASAIEKHADAEDPFLRRAARTALVELEKREAPQKPAAGAATAHALRLVRELNALPKETRVLLVSNVALSDVGDTDWMTLAGYFNALAGSVPGGGDGFIEEAKSEATSEIFEFLLRCGNMRPESTAIANVGTVGPQGGGLGIFLRGDYEPGVLSTSLSEPESGFTRREVSGVTVFEASEEISVVLLSDRSVLLLVEEGSKHFPLEAYLKSYSEERKELVTNERFASFVKTLEQPFLTRGLAITDSVLMESIYSELNGAPPNLGESVRGMKEVELSTRVTKDEKLDFRLESLFEKKEHATDLTTFLEEGLKAQIAQLEQLGVDIPQLKSMLNIMKSVRFSAEGERGILRVELPKMRILDFFTGVAIEE